MYISYIQYLHEFLDEVASWLAKYRSWKGSLMQMMTNSYWLHYNYVNKHIPSYLYTAVAIS